MKAPISRRDAQGQGQGHGLGAAAILWAVLMIAVGTLGLAACGSSSSGGGTATTSSSTPPASVAAAASTPQVALTGAAARCRRVSPPPPKTGAQAPPPKSHLDPSRTYTVTLVTNCGDIAIALDVKRAPITTASFASLVRRGFYDDLTFHRIVPGFVIQGGDPNGNGTGGPGYTVVEPPPAGLQYTRGVVAMAKTGSDPSGTSGSQFFIVLGANIGLPAQYALVGHVVKGEDVVQAIGAVPTETGSDGEDSVPSIPIVMEKVTISES